MGRRLRSKTVKFGRNAEITSYGDDKYVRCWNCRFICNTDRDLHARRGARSGDGISSSTNLLSNGHFDDWSDGVAKAPDDWRAALGNVARSSDYYYDVGNTSECSAQLTAWTAPYNNGVLGNQLTVTTYNGRDITFKCQAKTKYKNCTRLYISAGGEQTYSNFHPGDGNWHPLEVTATIPDDATSVNHVLQVKATEAFTALFDKATSVMLSEVQSGCPLCGCLLYQDRGKS